MSKRAPVAQERGAPTRGESPVQTRPGVPPRPITQPGCWDCAYCRGTDVLGDFGLPRLICTIVEDPPKWSGLVGREIRDQIRAWISRHALEVYSSQICKHHRRREQA